MHNLQVEEVLWWWYAFTGSTNHRIIFKHPVANFQLSAFLDELFLSSRGETILRLHCIQHPPRIYLVANTSFNAPPPLPIFPFTNTTGDHFLLHPTLQWCPGHVPPLDSPLPSRYKFVQTNLYLHFVIGLKKTCQAGTGAWTEGIKSSCQIIHGKKG